METPVASMDYDSRSGSEEVRCEPRPQPNPDLAKLLQFKVYRRRWFILLVLCILNCSNAMVWAPYLPTSLRGLEVSTAAVFILVQL